jgi:DNA repair photolyase
MGPPSLKCRVTSPRSEVIGSLVVTAGDYRAIKTDYTSTRAIEVRHILSKSMTSFHPITNSASFIPTPDVGSPLPVCLHQDTAMVLGKFKEPHGNLKYGMVGNKPVILMNSKTVLNTANIAFRERLFCDGLTLEIGDACAISSTFCYAPNPIQKQQIGRLTKFNRESGLNLALDQVVIQRRNCLKVLSSQLLHKDGSRIYDDPSDQRVVFAPTLVDVRGDMTMLRKTAAECSLILENTNWEIRVLSKSPVMKALVTHNLIPGEYQSRISLGFVIGTCDDKIAAIVEPGIDGVRRRIGALRELQDLGIRTFVVIGPSLPYDTQEEYDEFSRRMCEKIRPDRCEHVWAEVIPPRGDWPKATVTALRSSGYEAEAKRLEEVSGQGESAAWDKHARMTFEAHKKHVPADKLHFLQFVDSSTASYWFNERVNGAVLLDRNAGENTLVTTGTSAPTKMFPDLEEDDVLYCNEREEIISHGIKSWVAAAQALHQIHSYKSGILWCNEFSNFEDYCRERWGYEKSHAYRHVKAGEFLQRLVESHSPIGENIHIRESHVRPVLEMVPENLQIDCWQSITAAMFEKDRLTAPLVRAEVGRFLKEKGVASTKAKRPPKDARVAAISGVKKLEALLAELAQAGRFGPLTKQILQMIEQGPPDGAATATPEITL